MQATVLKGTLSEAEQDAYVRQVMAKYPISAIEKLILEIQGEEAAVHCVLHRFRNLRKMGGYCIGEPSDWNDAKQTEDTLWETEFTSQQI